MIVCDICGMPAKFESYVYTKPSQGQNMSLCPRCYDLLEEEKEKKLIEATQKVIEIRAAEVNEKDKKKTFVDFFREKFEK